MSLVVFTAMVGLAIAPGSIHPVEAFVAVLCIAIGGGASGALNMWYDADIDAIMKRTANRPIPAGRITPNEALSFGLTLSAASVLVLGLLINWLAAGLLAFTIFFYVVIYTMWLKRSTPQNIVIGGAAGAFPPMIGWAAVTGSISVESILLFLIIFMWTPPHFWALALIKNEDYRNAGVPMLPMWWQVRLQPAPDPALLSDSACAFRHGPGSYGLCRRHLRHSVRPSGACVRRCSSPRLFPTGWRTGTQGRRADVRFFHPLPFRALRHPFGRAFIGPGHVARADLICAKPEGDYQWLRSLKKLN